jgi:hypothetical protein
VHGHVQIPALAPVQLAGQDPDVNELQGWSISAWALLDCADQERRRRLSHQGRPDSITGAVHDAQEYRRLGHPLIDTTGLLPDEVAVELAQVVLWLEEAQQNT